MKEETLEKLKRQTLVASNASSMRLSGVEVTDEKVVEILENNKSK